jgi:hypothetical protein
MDLYAYASVLGVLRALGGLPLEHPFDYIKTQQQISTQSASQVVRSTLTDHGVLKFYSGFLPNAVRTSIKQAYRFPLMVATPRFFRPFVRETTAQTLAGLTIALLESFIICPLERLKVWLMSKPTSTSLRANWRSLGLFRGLEPVILKQTVSWTTFMAANSFFKSQFRAIRGETDLSFSSVLGVSVLVGLTNTAATLPIDCLKSRMQSYGAGNASMRKVLTSLLAEDRRWEHRLRVLYGGWQARLCQFLIHSALTVTVLDRLDRMV